MTWTPLRFAADLDPPKSRMPNLAADALVSFLPMQDVGTGLALAPSETRELEDVYDGYTYMQDGDVAIATISPSFQNGKGGVVQGAVNGVCFATTELTPLRPRAGTDSRYLRYALQSESFLQTGVASLYGVAGQKRVPTQLLRDFKIWLPSLGRQERIADFLDRETRRQGNVERTIDALTALVQERMESLVHERINNQPHPLRPLKSLASFVNGFPFAPSDHGDSGLPIVRIAQLLDELAPRDYFAGVPDEYCHIDSGDLIFSWSATLTAKVWKGGPAYLNQHLFRVIPRGDVELRWLHHALNAAVPLMKAHMHGSTMTHITRATLSEIRIPVPSAGEQLRIADEIDTALHHAADVSANLESQRALLVERRQALITAAVTGQLDVEAVA